MSNLTENERTDLAMAIECRIAFLQERIALLRPHFHDGGYDFCQIRDLRALAEKMGLRLQLEEVTP